MGNRALLQERMPAMLLHEGTWEGVYTTVDRDGNVTDQHHSRVVCEFPDEGKYVYIQKNRFEWEDGNVVENEFGGMLEGNRILWDNDRFTGYGWTTSDDLILLTLDRNDRPGERFTEIIVMAPGGQNRSRTWHWYRDGLMYQRTLCDERRVE